MQPRIEQYFYERILPSAWESPESQSSQPYLRQYIRKSLQIPTFLQIGDQAVTCQTQDISPAGLRFVGDVELSPGTPLVLRFFFADRCHFNISGQVIYCLFNNTNSARDAIGIKFSAIRDWEQMILLSAVDELIQQTSPAREKSWLTILVSQDSYACEAAHLGAGNTGDAAETAKLGASSPVILPLHPSLATAATDEVLPPRLPLDAGSPLLTFPLLINGEDVDTRRYKYFIPVDKLLTDDHGVVSILKLLKQDQLPPEYQKYIYARYCVGNRETNRQAMEAAYAASKEFRYFPLSRRMKIAASIHELLLANKNRLIELMVKEGHPIRLAEWEFHGMEQAYRRTSLAFYGEHLTKKIGVAGVEDLYWKRKPDGVVCVSPPRNAPCSSSLIAGLALLGGNTLIVKPPLRSPISTLFLWRRVVHEALTHHGAPPGTLNLIVGNSEQILGDWLTSHHVNDILFIGDTRTGLQVGARAFENGKKAILELAGNDMMFIWKDAPLEEAIPSLLDGFMGSTQICMVPKKAFVHESIYNSFEAAFVEGVKTLKIGLPSDPQVSLSPVLKIAEFYEFLDDALSKGAELLCGGQRVNYQGRCDERGQFLTPAVLRITDLSQALQMRCVQEENFFPLIPLVKVCAQTASDDPSVRDVDIFRTMVQVANGNAYGLRVSAWANSSYYIEKFSEHIQNSGLLRINCRHAGFSPFLATHGGTGKSGGPYGELNYVWQKTTHLQGVSIAKVRKRPG